MAKKSLWVIAAIACAAFILAGYAWLYRPFYSDKAIPAGLNTHDYAKGLVKPKEGQIVKKFSLAAREGSLLLKEGLILPVWTFNGTVPGTEIRVTQGDFVQVELKNELKEPVTIHWHGYPVLSAMDGVPGLSQDSVKPGETFTYEFSADVLGTYWYHSHQESAKQVDKGLYGAFIVEPKKKEKIDKDFTLILDEWEENPVDGIGSLSGKKGSGNAHTSGMPGHGGTGPMTSEDEMMSTMYNIYTVNGKSDGLIAPLEVQKGDLVRLRFINAGYRSHGIHVPGQEFKVVSTDGQDIAGAGLLRDQVILIAPGERYDVEFTVTSGENFIIDAHDTNLYSSQIKIPVKVAWAGDQVRSEPITANYPVFDWTNYGLPGKGPFTLEQGYDIDYNVELNERVDGSVQKYTINGKTFEELPPLKVKTGDKVKFTLENKSNVDHPMHLHGHFFQVLSKNGVPVSGAPIRKDTILVKPGEKYVVAFKADNPGNWVQHCHELHHAAAGMIQRIEYTDFNPKYMPDPNNKFNKPE